MLGGVQGLSVLLQLVRTKLVAMFIGPEGVGLTSIFNQARELIHTTSNLGLDASGIRGISASYEQWRQAGTAEQKSAAQLAMSDQISMLRSWVMILAALGVLLCIVLAAPLSRFSFENYDHILEFVLLAPAVGFSTLACGELVVLRAIRRLKAIALVSMLNVVAGIIVTVPIYYLWGISGVVFALVAFGLAQAFIVMCFSFHYARPRYCFGVEGLKKGLPMFQLGLSFVISGIMASGMELFIRTYINGIGSEYSVGLYQAGYTITSTYAALVFTAFESDYFPRLSGVITDLKLRCQTVSQQLEVVLMLIGPILVAMTIALPVLLPLLYTDEFCEVIPMTQIAVVSILFRAIYLPMVYLPLAAGHSRTYLFIQFIGSLDLLLVAFGYSLYGLWGAGLGLTAGNFIDMLLVHAYARYKYNVRISSHVLCMIGVYAAFVLLTYALTLVLDGASYWVSGVLLVVLSSGYSLYHYRHVPRVVS